MIQIIRPDKRDIDQKNPLQHRGYRTMGDLKRGIAMLRKQGYNYFVSYKEGCPKARESGQTFAIQACHADWVVTGQVYIIW